MLASRFKVQPPTRQISSFSLEDPPCHINNMTETENTPEQEQSAPNNKACLSLKQFLDGNTPQVLDPQQAEDLARTIQEQWPTIDKTSISVERLRLLREGIVQSKISIPPEHAYEFLTLSLDLMKGLREDNIGTFVQLVLARSKSHRRKRAAEGSTESNIDIRELLTRLREATAYMEQIAQRCEAFKALVNWIGVLQLHFPWDKVSFTEAVQMCDREDQTIHALWLELTNYALELRTQAARNAALIERYPG